MAYEIERRIVKAIPLIKLQSKSYIIAHESGNANNIRDNALDGEISYMSNNWRNAFTHLWAGPGRIVQIAEMGYMCYGAGFYLNPHSPMQIELVRVDTQAEFDDAYKRYVWALRYAADKFGIPKTLDSNSRTGIKTHEWVSKNLGGTNHTDPYGYLAKWGISRAEFKRDVENGIKETPATISKPAAPTNSGESIVDYLKSKGMDSSFAARGKLAVEYGIKNYSGSPEQNVLLLKLVKAGKPKPIEQPKPTPAKKPTPPKTVEKPKEGKQFMKPKQWQKEEMAKIYDKAAEQGIFTDKSHGEKIKKGEMTFEDGIYLATVLAGAAINDPGRIK